MRVDGSGKCPGYTLGASGALCLQGACGAGPWTLGPFTQCCRNSFPSCPCPVRSYFPEEPTARSLLCCQITPPLPLRLLRGLLVSVPHLFFLPQPPSSDDLPEPGPSGSSCWLLPTGKRGLGGQKGLGPERPQLLASPLSPPTLVLTPGLLLPFSPLPLAGPLSSRDHSRVTLPARGKGGSFTSASSHVHPAAPFSRIPRTSPWKPVCFQRR